MSYIEDKARIKNFGFWRPVEDNDSLLIECPYCGKRMIVECYTYEIYYRFCPYCGEELIQKSLFDD